MPEAVFARKSSLRRAKKRAPLRAPRRSGAMVLRRAAPGGELRGDSLPTRTLAPIKPEKVYTESRTLPSGPAPFQRTLLRADQSLDLTLFVPSQH